VYPEPKISILEPACVKSTTHGMKVIRMTQKTNGLRLLRWNYETCVSLHHTKWKLVLPSRKNVLKECVLIFVKTLGTYTKQHNTFVLNFLRKRLPSSSRRLMYLTRMLLLLRRGTVFTVSAEIRTFSNQGYSTENGRTLKSSDWPKSLKSSDISDIFPPLNHFSTPMNQSHSPWRQGKHLPSKRRSKLIINGVRIEPRRLTGTTPSAKTYKPISWLLTLNENPNPPFRGKIQWLLASLVGLTAVLDAV
jgi:hypothetical protein